MPTSSPPAHRPLGSLADQARRAIHADDRKALAQLLDEHPALLAHSEASGATLLSYAVEAFGACRDAVHERAFTRRDCAELLVERGAKVDEATWRNVVTMRSRNMLELLSDRGLLPPALRVAAALGDLERVRARLASSDRAERHEACMDACAFGHTEVAAFLLERCIDLDPTLAQRIDAGPGRDAFLSFLAEHDARFGAAGDVWQSYVVGQLRSAIAAEETAAFAERLQRERWLLEDAAVALQVELLELATYTGREAFIRLLLDADPAVLRRRPPPPSAAIEYAFEYGHASYVPLLARIWAVPDDLPHAAARGELERVKRWFDADGRLVSDALDRHYPLDTPRKLQHLRWRAGDPQHVLDTAFAWACLNHRFETARFLLDRGANIDTDWSTHEPASILHECAIQRNFAAAEFLIERGADLSRLDHRWRATPEGWARFAANDEAMAEFLVTAARHRSERSA